MSAIMLSLISVGTMVVSFAILLHLVVRGRFTGFDGVAILLAMVLFTSTLLSTTLLGAYGYNTIRNGGHHGSGLSLSRD